MYFLKAIHYFKLFNSIAFILIVFPHSAFSSPISLAGDVDAILESRGGLLEERGGPQCKDISVTVHTSAKLLVRP
jgi:hypothetical protein